MNNKEILEWIANKNADLLQEQTKEMLKFEKVIDDLVILCSSEIMRYSMQNFMEWFTREERYKIAVWIAQKSYAKAQQEIMNYFFKL